MAMRARAHMVRPPALDGFASIRRFWDPLRGMWNAQVLPGDCYVSKHDEVITTVLGSCVSACVRDPEESLGGMNHFMLPSDPEDERGGTSARYGAFALQRLVSELVRHGAERARLEVKIFGGGQVLAGVTDIGQANIEFVRGFFASEGLTIVAEDVGDRFARRLRYHPRTGQAMVNRLPVRDAVALAAREHRLRQGMAERLRAKLPRVY